MKSLKALSAALGLVAALSAGTALASAKPLFNFEDQAWGAPPAFGTSVGTVVVDDGFFTGAPPYGLRTKQLLIDSQGTSDFSGVLGSYVVPAIPASISYFQYSFTVAVATTFQYTYNFLTNQDRQSGDFFVAALFDGVMTQTNLAAESASGSTLFASPSFYLWETGTQLREFTVGAGSYTAEFIIGSNQSGCLNNGLCIPTGVVLNSIPEPTSLALVALALIGVAAPRARRAAKNLAA